jgi:hypothetical protein
MRMADNQSVGQAIWGAALTIMGISVIFYTIPQRLPEIIDQYQQLASARYFIYFCFYLMGVILVAGGLRKLYRFFKATS